MGLRNVLATCWDSQRLTGLFGGSGSVGEWAASSEHQPPYSVIFSTPISWFYQGCKGVKDFFWLFVLKGLVHGFLAKYHGGRKEWLGRLFTSGWTGSREIECCAQLPLQVPSSSINHDQGASSHPNKSSLKTPLRTCPEVRLTDLAYSLCSQADGENQPAYHLGNFYPDSSYWIQSFLGLGVKPFAWQSLGTVDTVQTPSMKASVFFDVLFSTSVTSGWPGQSYQLDD